VVPAGVNSTSSSSNSAKGVLFTPSKAMTVVGLVMNCPVATNAASYVGYVWTLTSNSPGATTVATVVGSSDSVAVPSTILAGTIVQLPCTTPIALVSGATYAVMVYLVGGSTAALPMPLAVATGASDLSAYIPGSFSASVVSAVSSPTVGSAVTVAAATAAGGRFHVGMVVDF
jgi:hypothetical protein